jgi:hypothetical protein
VREVIKHAKLFEAGDYPDKGLSVSEEDLDVMARTSGEVPLTVGHLDPDSENPLRLGAVSNLHRKGRELFGVIRFAPEAWSLLLRSGAKYLSVCLDRLRKRLLEVSLVVKPRVPDARVRFSEDETPVRIDVPFDSTLDDKAGAVRAAIYEAFGPGVWVPEVYEDHAIVERGADLLKVPHRLTRDGAVRLGRGKRVERKYVPLGAEDTRSRRPAEGSRSQARLHAEVEARIERWRRDGRITPATEKHARRLLLHAEPETRRVFMDFVEAQPESILFTQVTPFAMSDDEPLPELEPTEAALCERFGIGLDEYRRIKRSAQGNHRQIGRRA